MCILEKRKSIIAHGSFETHHLQGWLAVPGPVVFAVLPTVVNPKVSKVTGVQALALSSPALFGWAEFELASSGFSLPLKANLVACPST